MTREEIADWVKSLKPGDKVIHYSSYNGMPSSVMFVHNVTPSGIVKTTNGERFKQKTYFDDVRGYGKSYGYIVPCTSELEKMVEECEERRRKQDEEFRIIRHAKATCLKLAHYDYDLSLEMAQAILKLVEGDENS